jgi:type II secretory pathway component PulK
MTGNRGFALVAALWVIVALTSVVGLGVATTTLGQRTTVNRITLTRGRWAAEACLAITQRRWLQHHLSDTGSIDLGRSAHCRWRIDDPGARINVNTADLDVLERLLGDSLRVDSFVRTRRELRFISVMQLPEELRSVLTVEGNGSVNLNAASARVLAALPGMTGEAVERIIERRQLGKPLNSLDELAGALSPSARASLLARYQDLARIAVFTPGQLLITTTGTIEHQAPQATIELVTVPLPDRLAVIRRRLW